MKDRNIYCLNNIAKIGTDGFRSGYTLIDSMRGFWEGDAAEAYIEMMHRNHIRALNLLTTLQKLKAAVDTQISELSNVDNFFEKLWYQLFVN